MSRRQKLILALVGLILLFILVLGVGIMWVFSDASGSLFEGGGELLLTEEYDGVETVETDLVSYSVEVAAWDGDTVAVSFYSRGISRAREPEIRMENGRLTVTEQRGWGRFWNLSAGRVVVQVPRAARLSYALRGVSGRVGLDAPAETADIKTVSGSVRVLQDGGSLTATTTSGSIEVSQPFETLNLKTVSGSVKVFQGGESLTASTTSGSIRAYRPFDAVNLRTVSGSIRAAADADSREMQLNTVSGSVRVRLEGEVPGYTLNHSTTSGSVKDEYHGLSFGKTGVDSWGDGSLSVVAGTTSGSIKLTAWED